MKDDKDMLDSLRNKQERLGFNFDEQQEVDKEFFERKKREEEFIDPYELEERKEQREQMKLRSRYLNRQCRK